jgi:hypothetical protein
MPSDIESQVGDDLETILTRLTEVIEWCAPHVDLGQPKNCLRSIELIPHLLEDGRKRVVGSVALKRYLALGRPKRTHAKDLAGGRLLLYEPDINLAHGLEESETCGYVDLDNTPPWDTWIAYLYDRDKKYDCDRNFLLSWVPDKFISLVTAGIRVSPEVSFSWLDEQDLKWTKILKDQGLV